MKIFIRILSAFIITLLFILYQGCGGMYMYAKKAEEAPMAEEKVAYDRKEPAEQPAVSEEEGIKTSHEELAYVPVKILERKRVYSGYCKLRVDSVEKTKNRIFTIAEQSGGYVESSYSEKIVIRIPAEKFSEIFNTILDLGEVIHKSVETYDVTEQFQDLTTRLEIAEKTRERLYELLEKTDDVDERFRILKEIKRLTDEIESIKQKIEMIKKLISLSRITVELIPRLVQEREGKEKIPFDWIRNMDPLYVSLRNLEGKINFELSGDFAVFEKEVTFRAESAEGTRVRIGTTHNEPAGDSGFWQKALSYYLSDYYKETEELELGEVKGIIFTSKDTKPFYYLAGVVSKKDTLYIIEVFFPDKAALDKRLDGIKKSLGGFSVR